MSAFQYAPGDRPEHRMGKPDKITYRHRRLNLIRHVALR